MAGIYRNGKKWRAVNRKSRHSTTRKSFNNKARAKILARETESKMDQMEWGDATLVKDMPYQYLQVA